jgi:(E)-4-hydroxy-3-methylbut-2-enyl-diphosphate synthase
MSETIYDSNTILQYCNSLTNYSRRKTIEVKIGDVPLGGNNPIRIQSMTTIDTMDTAGSVEQSIRMIEAGCEYIRITAPSVNEARNLENIKKELRSRGYHAPLIAGIHFTPNAAEISARIVEKVRINPGNYADKKKFESIEYTDSAYEAELERIRQKFTPLVKICKECGTAMRIGANHGSLSDRIMSRYGDTPLGMVESALEFLRICEDMDYHDVVLSMKASNPQVMVQAYRLLVQKMNEEDLKPYPLHLGVTEAGEGEDGRIKSAMGIGALLEDGLGDTVRVSLTEEPEAEAPVAKKLVDRYIGREQHQYIKPVVSMPINPFSYTRRATNEVANIGGKNPPRVIADLSRIGDIEYQDLKGLGHYYLPELDKWRMGDQGVDYVYSGSRPVPFMLPNGLKEILDFDIWKTLEDKVNKIPLINISNYDGPKHPEINFIKLMAKDLQHEAIGMISTDNRMVLILESDNLHAMAEMRRFFFELMGKGLQVPVVISRNYQYADDDDLRIDASTDIGSLLLDGMGDGIMLGLSESDSKSFQLGQLALHNSISFGILQAARTRISKTEYISCPSCGRTLFDLQETTAIIRKRTDHLKGVKIGIMGCIVNGPGEMADADYGYVGSGKGMITLYKGKEVVKRAIPTERAVDELIGIIKTDGRWIEPGRDNFEL